MPLFSPFGEDPDQDLHFSLGRPDSLDADRDLLYHADRMTEGTPKEARFRWSRCYLGTAHRLTAAYWTSFVERQAQMPAIDDVLAKINALSPCTLSVSEEGLVLFASALVRTNPPRYKTYRFCLCTDTLTLLFTTPFPPLCVCESPKGELYGCLLENTDDPAIEQYDIELYDEAGHCVAHAGSLSVRQEQGYQVLTFHSPTGTSQQELRLLAPLPIRDLLRHALRFWEDGSTLTLQIPDHIRELPVPHEVRDVLGGMVTLVRSAPEAATIGLLSRSALDGALKIVCYQAETHRTYTIEDLRDEPLNMVMSPDARWIGGIYRELGKERRHSLRVDVYAIETGKIVRTYRIERHGATPQLDAISPSMLFLSDGSLLVFLKFARLSISSLERHEMVHLPADPEQKPITIGLGMFRSTSVVEAQGRVLLAGEGLLPTLFIYDFRTYRLRQTFSPTLASRLGRSMCMFAEGDLLFAQALEVSTGSIFRVERTEKSLRLYPLMQLPFRLSRIKVAHVVGDTEQTCYPIVDALRDYIDMYGTEIAPGVNWQLNPPQSWCSVRSHFYFYQRRKGVKTPLITVAPDGNGFLSARLFMRSKSGSFHP